MKAFQIFSSGIAPIFSPPLLHNTPRTPQRNRLLASSTIVAILLCLAALLSLPLLVISRTYPDLVFDPVAFVTLYLTFCITQSAVLVSFVMVEVMWHVALRQAERRTAKAQLAMVLQNISVTASAALNELDKSFSLCDHLLAVERDRRVFTAIAALSAQRAVLETHLLARAPTFFDHELAMLVRSHRLICERIARLSLYHEVRPHVGALTEDLTDLRDESANTAAALHNADTH